MRVGKEAARALTDVGMALAGICHMPSAYRKCQELVSWYTMRTVCQQMDAKSRIE